MMQVFLEIESLTVITFMFPILTVLFLFHYNAYDVKTGSLDARAFKSYIKELDGKSFAIMSLYLKEFIIDGDDDLSISFINYNYRANRYVGRGIKYRPTAAADPPALSQMPPTAAGSNRQSRGYPRR